MTVRQRLMSPSEAQIRKAVSTRLGTADPEVARLIRQFHEDDNRRIDLIASNNFPSVAVMETGGHGMGTKYSEGRGDDRYYRVSPAIKALEALACERGRQVFGVEHFDVQPADGAGANEAVYMALLRKKYETYEYHGTTHTSDDVIVGLVLSHGGHLSHGTAVNVSGRDWQKALYHIDLETRRIDFDRLRGVVRDLREKGSPDRRILLVAGASGYPYKMDYPAYRSIADEFGCLVMADISHIMDLVAAGVHPSPAPYVDVITSTLQKAGGPKGAFIGSKKEFAEALNKAVFPGTQGGPNNDAIPGKAVMLFEAMQPWFVEAAKRTVENAAALANALAERGISVLGRAGDHTENHLFFVNVKDHGLNGDQARDALDRAGFTINGNSIAGDKIGQPSSGLRYGTKSVSRRGMETTEMPIIAEWNARVLKNPTDYGLAERVAEEVAEFTKGFQRYAAGTEPKV